MKVIFLFLEKFHITHVVLAGLVLLVLICCPEQGKASAAITPDQCCSCHLDVCEQSTTKRYVHAPVLENHCAVCHVKGGMPPVAQQAGDEEAHEEIAWFARDCQENNEHWFELPSHLASTTVSLMAKVGGRKVLEQEVALPSFENAERFPPQGGMAEIFDLRVVEVKKGVFLTARIAWKTDRITNAQVLYGEDSLNSRTALDDRWATNHEITVAGLDGGRNYRFVAVSQDINGNKAMSPEMLFSTRAFFDSSRRQGENVPVPVAMKANFYQQQGRVFGHFEADYPVSLRLGSKGQQHLAMAAQESQLSRPQGHLELTDPHSLTITVCVSCHPQAKGVHSHPVGIRPKAGMHIPSDYKIMADGRLSCMSCHQAHASDNEYRLTRASRKDLCLGCHRNFG